MRWLVFSTIFCATMLSVGCVIQPPNFNTKKECFGSFDCLSYEICTNGRCEPINTCTNGASRACGDSNDPGLCSGGTQVCKNGVWSQCSFPQASTEICDGKDNDCNGQIDETYPEKNKFCRVLDQKGPCARGEFRSCTLGRLVCLSTSQARAEGPNYGNCSDGIDNDCDGFTDDPTNDGCKKCVTGETQDCYPFGQGTNDPTLRYKPCKTGKQKCENGKWTICTGHVVPIGEICGNKIDDDCDGIADDNCADPNKCKPLGSRRPCYEGKTGTEDVGPCKAGLQTCQSNGQWSACIGQVKPLQEVCGDKIDNDCNGKVDDCSQGCTPGATQACYTGDAATRKKGSCKDGKQVCGSNKQWGACTGEILPSTQLCTSGKDEDCNGRINDCKATELLIASATPATNLRSLSLRNYKVLRTFTGHTGTVNSISVASNGQSFVSGGQLGQLILWNRNGTSKWTQSAHRGALNSVAYSPSGNFIATTGGTDLQTRLWLPTSGTPAPSFQAHVNPVWSLALSPSGTQLATASADKTIKLWSLVGQTPAATKTLTGHTSEVLSIAYDKTGGYLLSGSRDGNIILWNLARGSNTPINLGASVNAVAFSADGKAVAAASESGILYTFKFINGKLQKWKNYKVPSAGKCTAVAFHPDGLSVAIGDSNGYAYVWAMDSAKLLVNFKASATTITGLAFLP